MIEFVVTLPPLGAEALERVLAALTETEGTYLLERLTITPKEA